MVLHQTHRVLLLCVSSQEREIVSTVVFQPLALRLPLAPSFPSVLLNHRLCGLAPTTLPGIKPLLLSKKHVEQYFFPKFFNITVRMMNIGHSNTHSYTSNRLACTVHESQREACYPVSLLQKTFSTNTCVCRCIDSHDWKVLKHSMDLLLLTTPLSSRHLMAP